MSSSTTFVAPPSGLDDPAAVGHATFPSPCTCDGASRHAAVPPGLRRALQQLNATTRFRFTALYRPERSRLVGLWVHDRENPRVNGGAAREAPACCYRAAGIEPPRLATVASRAASTVPDRWHDVHTLRQRDGALLGVLCHSDARPRLVDELTWVEGEPMIIAIAEWLASARPAAIGPRRHVRAMPSS